MKPEKRLPVGIHIRTLMFMVLGLVLLTGAITVHAQQASPTPAMDDQTAQDAQQVVEDYLNTHNPDLLADDVLFTDPYAQSPVVGRDTVAQREGDFYGGAFNLDLVPWRFSYSNDMVIVEFQYADTTIDAASIPSPDLDVAVPMVGIYHVENGQITSARMYYDAATLQNQPGAAVNTGMNPATTPNVAATSVDDITGNAQVFDGQSVSIEANVGRAVTDRAFVVYDDALIGRGSEMLVIPQDDVDFIQLADTHVRVQGVVHTFDRAALQNQVNVDLTNSAYDEFDAQPVLIASTVTNLDNVNTIQTIVDTPEAFYGKTISVNGVVGDMLSSDAGYIHEDATLGVDRVLVINTSGDPFDFATENGAPVTVTGTVRQFVQTDIENEYGLTLDDAAFGAYEGQPVIVADRIGQ